MDEVYATAYPNLYATHWWWRVRESLILAKVAEILAEHSGTASILDVGCGAGLLFDALQRFGDVTGIEADLASVERSGRWRGHIYHGELDAAFDPSRRFDLILLLDVIEHLDDPVGVLREGARRLVDGGSLLVTVPAFEWLWTRHDDVNEHRRRYTARQLRDALECAGTFQIETRYLFQSLVVPKLLVRGKETLLRQSHDVPRVPSGPINRLLQVWYRSENAIAGQLPFGTSVMAVGRTAR